MESYVVWRSAVVVSEWVIRRVAAGVRYVCGIRMSRDAHEHGIVKYQKSLSITCEDDYTYLLTRTVHQSCTRQIFTLSLSEHRLGPGFRSAGLTRTHDRLRTLEASLGAQA